MDFNFEQYATGGGNSTDNSVDVNNNLEFVEIHNNVGQNWLFYGAGTIDGDKAVFQADGRTLSAGTFGFNPRISINDQRAVVATFRGGYDPLRYLYCQTGTYANGVVTWFGTTQKTYCSTPDNVFDTSINDTHFVLAYTYRTWTVDWNHLHAYVKLGQIDAATGNITWLDDGWNDVGCGTLPSISLNRSGTVVVLVQSTNYPNKVFYKIGHVDGNTVAWDAGGLYIAEIDAPNISSVSITLSDTNEVMVAIVSNQRSYYMLGFLTSDRKSIVFNSKPIPFFVGKHSGQNVLVVTRSGGGKLLVACNDGTLFAGMYIAVGSGYKSWIGDNIARYGPRKLREFTLPGSHDAAMSTIVNCTTYARACNTQTQVSSIAIQLAKGIRYFDLRPVLRPDGLIALGHYNTVAGTSVGCQGESVNDVLDAVARFLSTAGREVVILAFSHFRVLSTSQENLFPQNKFDDFIATIRQRLAGYLLAVCPAGRLADQTLADLTINGGVALPIIDCNNPMPAACDGVFTYLTLQNGMSRSNKADISIFDDYSKTDSLPVMVNGQFQYFASVGNRQNSDLYLFSWTLTQNSYSAFACPLPGTSSILDLARQANAALSQNVRNAVANGKFAVGMKPNLLFVDACGGGVTDLCIWMNNTL